MHFVAKKKAKIFLSFCILSICFPSEAAQWAHSPGSYKSERYYEGDQINPSNISDLEVAWKFSSGKIDETLTVQSSPIYTETKIISSSPTSLFALDPNNGNLIWEIELEYKINPRGITYVKDPMPRIYLPTQNGVLEIDEQNGKILGNFKSGRTYMPPVINGKNIIIATLHGGIKSYNLNSKELVWHTSLEMNGYKASIWSGFSFDYDTQLAYVVTGSYGGLMGWYRTEPNLESNIIAINVQTGKIEWRFQYIEHDLWDLDLVGNPILLDLVKNGKQTRAVLALSKKGDTILLNAIDGKPFYDNSFEMVKAEKSDIPSEQTAPFQKNFILPEPFYDFNIDAESTFDHLDNNNKQYVDQKIRHVNKLGIFLPPSLNNDILMYGINGGANLGGGAIDFSGENPALIVPFNKEPWILRAFYTDKIHRLVEKLTEKYQSFQSATDEESNFQNNCASCHVGGHAPSRMDIGNMPADDIYTSLTTGIMASQAQNLTLEAKRELAQYLGKETQKMAESVFTSLPFVPKNKIYIENCSSCHGISRKGSYQFESEGDGYYPPLVGVTLTNKNKDIKEFKKIKAIHEYFNISYEVSEQEHHSIFDEFTKYDSRLNKLGLLSSRGFWQLLLDREGYPASKPPWGGIAKIDLISGKKLWSIPFGARLDNKKNVIAVGDKNFGGVLTTSSGLIFVNGTADSKAYGYDTDGNLIWSDQMTFAGSAPPISYMHNSCQFILFTATGGKVLPFTKKDNGDELIAYKLKDCIEEDIPNI
jgi:quinoprotein glucose dehydrogenase